MEGRSPAQINQKFGDIYLPALFANWKVWPLAQVRFLVMMCAFMVVWLTSRVLVDQLPLHASCVPRALSVNVRCLLDTIPVYP